MIHFMRLVSIISKCEVSCDVIMGGGVERADSGGGYKNKNDCLNFFFIHRVIRQVRARRTHDVVLKTQYFVAVFNSSSLLKTISILCTCK